MGNTLYAKFIQNAEFVKKIDQKIISEKKILISEAIKGSYSDTVNVAFDMGATIYCCYYFDDEEKIYTKIELLVDGDWQYYNQSPEAQQLVNWLKTIPGL